MKKCMICGWDESDDSMFTCPACGEASWGSGPLQWTGLDGIVPAPAPEPEVPVKRGPGRPRKTS